MGLKAILVDRAHTVSRGPTGPSVEGETPYGPVDGPEFACRASSPSFTERQFDERYEYTRDLTLLVPMTDLVGNPIVIEAEDKLVLTSAGSPSLDGLYRVMGHPEPVRKKRKQILWNVALHLESRDADG